MKSNSRSSKNCGESPESGRRSRTGKDDAHVVDCICPSEDPEEFSGTPSLMIAQGQTERQGQIEVSLERGLGENRRDYRSYLSRVSKAIIDISNSEY